MHNSKKIYKNQSFNYYVRFIGNKIKIKSFKEKDRKIFEKINIKYPHKLLVFFKILKSIKKITNKFQLNKCIEIRNDPTLYTYLINFIFGTKIIFIKINSNTKSNEEWYKKIFFKTKIHNGGYKKIIKKYKTISNALNNNDIIYIEYIYISKISSNFCNFSIYTEKINNQKKVQSNKNIDELKRILIPNNFVIVMEKKNINNLDNLSLTHKSIFSFSHKKISKDLNCSINSSNQSNVKISIIKLGQTLRDIF